MNTHGSQLHLSHQHFTSAPMAIPSYSRPSFTLPSLQVREISKQRYPPPTDSKHPTSHSQSPKPFFSFFAAAVPHNHSSAPPSCSSVLGPMPPLTSLTPLPTSNPTTLAPLKTPPPPRFLLRNHRTLHGSRIFYIIHPFALSACRYAPLCGCAARGATRMPLTGKCQSQRRLSGAYVIITRCISSEILVLVGYVVESVATRSDEGVRCPDLRCIRMLPTCLPSTYVRTTGQHDVRMEFSVLDLLRNWEANSMIPIPNFKNVSRQNYDTCLGILLSVMGKFGDVWHEKKCGKVKAVQYRLRLSIKL
jgi:hypothetical protein